MSGNTIAANTSNERGGGLYLFRSPATLEANLIISNVSNLRGGGLSLLGGSDATLTNNVIADNVGTALHIGHSSPRLLHNTIARNRSSDGGAINVAAGGAVTMTNTILVSHTVGISVTVGGTATLEATLWGVGEWANLTDWQVAGSITIGMRNYWASPAFVDPDARDYHIGLGSAALDAGVNAGVYRDIDGEARPFDSNQDGIYEYDIGADECTQQYSYLHLPVLLKNH